jgi:tRNA(adenine34) deaminase
MIRELKVKEVVFALLSPSMGGYSRWDILQDQGLTRFKPVFTTPPKVFSGILKKEAAEQFEKAGWTIHKI